MRSSRRNSVLLTLPVVALVYAACSDGGPVDPMVEPSPPARAISDAVHGGGNEHFFWLPPMVGAPGSFNGAFDGTKSPVVTICDLADCAGIPIAEFSMTTGPGSETVRLQLSDEQYIVNWHVDEFPVQAGSSYRIEVRVGGTLLGYADVQLASNGQEAKNLTTNEIIGLKDGRTLPITFRIEEGAVFVVTAEEGGTVVALEGSVTLEVPPGALAEETGLTVEPVDEPVGTAVNAVEFGPDGLQFEEPVPVTLSYDPVQLPAGVAEEDLALNLLMDGRWIVLPGGSIDLVNETVTAPFHHFSTGGVGLAELALFCAGDGNPDTFDSMQEAVDAVMDGGTVEVCDGGPQPVEGVVVSHPVNIVAAAGASPVLQTSTELATFWVDGYTAGAVVIDGLTFDFDTPTGPDIPTRSYAIRAQNTYDQIIVRNSTFDVDPVGRGGVFMEHSSVSGSATLVETSRFSGGVYGITAQDGHLDVNASEFLGVGSVGILYFGSTNPSSGRVENSTFDDCGSAYCVQAFNGASVEVVSNDFTTLPPTGDSGPDLDQVLRFTGGATALLEDNDFLGCGYHRCILGASGASLTVLNNRFVLQSGDGANANPEHAVMIFHPDVTADVLNNRITGCWTYCISAQAKAVATIRGNTITNPDGYPPIPRVIHGFGGTDLTPGVVPDPADAPVLVIEDNLIEGVSVPADRSNIADYSIDHAILLQNAVATSVARNTILRAAVAISSMEGSDIQAGRDNVVETAVWAVKVSDYHPGDTNPSEDDGRATLGFSDFTDHHNAIWVRPDDTSSDLTCNYWGGPTGEPTGFTNADTEASIYAPWALMPIAGTGATDCAPAEIRVAAADDGSGLPFVPTVSAAVALVAPDGVVHVSEGTHSVEGVVVDRPMTIQAEAAASPVLQTSVAPWALRVDGYTTGTVVIDGLTFDFDTPDANYPFTTYAIRTGDDDGEVGGTWADLIVQNSTFDIDPAARGAMTLWFSTVPSSGTVENVTFNGGVFGISTSQTQLDVTNSVFAGNHVGVSYSESTGQVSSSTFDDCGRSFCVWVSNGSNVQIVSNQFTNPLPTGDAAPDLNQVVRVQSSATALIQNNDFDGCGYHRCVLGASGAHLTIAQNTFSLAAGGGAGADPEHAVIILHPDVTGDVLGNQITGCWVFCISVQPNAVATIRGNTITNPDGYPPIPRVIHGFGGVDFTPGLVPDPADAPVLVIEDNLIEGLTVPADRSNIADYSIDHAILLENAVATSVTGNTIRRAAVAISSSEGSDIQAGQDNVIETAVWAVKTSHYHGGDTNPAEDDGRATLRFNDFTDHHNAIWARPGDTSSDLTCNYWGGATGEPTGFTNADTEASIYTPWATAPIANGAGGVCDGGS